MKYQVRIGDRQHWVDVEPEGSGWRVSVDGSAAYLDAAELAPGAYSLLTNGRSREVAVDREGDALRVRLGGATYEMTVLDEVRARTQRPERKGLRSGPATLKAPMPGLVVDLRVKEGDVVAEGAALVIMEAMKMQNELASPAAGRVDKVHVSKGQSVESGQVLLTLAPMEAGA